MRKGDDFVVEVEDSVGGAEEGVADDRVGSVCDLKVECTGWAAVGEGDVFLPRGDELGHRDADLRSLGPPEPKVNAVAVVERLHGTRGWPAVELSMRTSAAE